MNINRRALFVAIVVALGSMVASFAAAAQDGAGGTSTEAVGPATGGSTESADTPEVVDAPQTEPTFDCREVQTGEVCDTFGESDEGPGTS